MSFGTLSIKDNAIPSFSPPYSNNPNKFSKITIISIAYRVTLASVQHLIPDVLELESEPLMTTWFIDYGMSSVGSYKEFLQFVEVTYKGEKFDYALFLALDNEAAIFAGREVFGFPKVFGKTDITFATGGRLVTGSIERPAGHRLATGEFIPENLVAPSDVPELKARKRTLCLRVVPSPIAGAPPSLRELIPILMGFEFQDVWVGKGNVSFPTTSAHDPWCNVEILRHEGAMLFTAGFGVLHPPTETFPVD